MKHETLTEMGRRYPKVGPRLEIKFKPQGINALRALWEFSSAGLVEFVQKILVLAILESNDWGGDQNRSVLVRLPLGYILTSPIFLEQGAEGIESIRLATPHPLNVLMTGRKKVQEEHANRIIQECIGNLNDADELPNYDLRITGELEVVNGLPQLTFNLRSADAIEAIIILDGWSGQTIVDGIAAERAYRNPKEFYALVRNLALDYLEKVTA
ncbi:hypothetical protein L6270_04510 [Candidatus Parcubacteria bacterium]|nr:hypothetical protein [Patescibacteria group bacterium]MBU4309225.1 hypothetical protein [Patescibacteria group bacterium]MBU4577586.1 hypothetical protein [Patescibacteria group bacterium]MCG2697273.1 hypothetical protein [Candidatus Parcubacteria bacterium]